MPNLNNPSPPPAAVVRSVPNCILMLTASELPDGLLGIFVVGCLRAVGISITIKADIWLKIEKKHGLKAG